MMFINQYILHFHTFHANNNSLTKKTASINHQQIQIILDTNSNCNSTTQPSNPKPNLIDITDISYPSRPPKGGDHS